MGRSLIEMEQERARRELRAQIAGAVLGPIYAVRQPGSKPEDVGAGKMRALRDECADEAIALADALIAKLEP